MSNSINWINKERHLEILVVSFFFINLLFIGLAIYGDYGISWDEPLGLENGLESYNYIFQGNNSLLTYDYNNLGVAFELPLVIVQKTLNLNDSRDIFLMRHLLTFLFCFIGVFFFYLLCKKYFKSWKIGLLGSLFLVLSPRIFANFFYNSKDAVFLSAFIISIYTLIMFLEKKTYLSAGFHAIVCAFLIDVRIIGLIVPFITFLMFIPAIIQKKRILKKDIFLLGFYGITTFLLIILLWPFLWSNPLNFFEAVTRLHTGDSLPFYFGHYLQVNEIPWSYLFVWIGITIQPLYLLLFFIGLYELIKEIFKKNISLNEDKKKYKILILLWLIIPFLAFFITKSVPYDSWRHLFFIYPALLIITLYGALNSYYLIKKIPNKIIKKSIAIIFILAIIITSLLTLRFMIMNHPHQDVYFNIFAG
ncbi:MAG: glycosyltransferase family 39 protein, partial [archaeon]|nr:glycosyltransferase family 39 protein [archaeon]